MRKHFLDTKAHFLHDKIISKEMYPVLKIHVKNVGDFAMNKIIQIVGQI